MFPTLLSYLTLFICGARPKKPSSKPNRKTFHPFSRLPLELRLHIWSLALHQDAQNIASRQIALYRYAHQDRHGFSRISLSRKYTTLFSVNREARCEAARVLGGEWVDIDRGWTGTRDAVKIYVNFECDAVLLRGCSALFVKGEEGWMWNGHAIAPWKYGRNLESADPIYVAGAKMRENEYTGDTEERTMRE